MRPLVIAVVAGFVGFGLSRCSSPESGWVDVRGSENATTGQTSNGAGIETAPLTDSTSKPGGSIYERLTDSIKSRDVFISARKLQASLEAMTLADFQSIVADPDLLPIPTSYGFDMEFSESFLDAFVERWLELDPEGAFVEIRKLDADRVKRQRSTTNDLATAMARVKPELILKSVAEDGTWTRQDTSVTAAFSRMAMRDPSAARRYLERISDPDRLKSAKLAIAYGVSRVDPLGAVDLARELNDQNVCEEAVRAAARVGPGMLRRVLAANDGKFDLTNAMPELLLRYPTEDLHEFLDPAAEYASGVSTTAMTAASRLTSEERTTLLANLEAAPSGLGAKVTEAILYGWAREQPREATEWAMAHAKPDENSAPETIRVGAAFYQWFNSDPTIAMDWYAKLPESPLRTTLGNGIATFYAADGRLDEALALYRPDGGRKVAETAAQLAESAAERDPVMAAQWLGGLPGDGDFEKPAAAVIGKWLIRDSAAAARWVESQPPGPRRDAAFSAYARQAAELDPYAAGDWAAKVGDAKLRAVALEAVYQQMKWVDPPGARAWIRSVPGLEATWCERLIRSR